MILVKDGKYIALSDGNPYLVSGGILNAQAWYGFDEIERYRVMFPDIFNGASIYTVQLGPLIKTLDESYLTAIKQAKIDKLQSAINKIKSTMQ